MVNGLIQHLGSNFSYENILEQIPSLICVQDIHSKVLYSNSHTAGLFGYPDASSLHGMGPYDMRCPAVESANKFLEQDKYVRQNNEAITILDVHVYSDDNLRILVTKKTPYYVGDKLSGTICQCTEIDNNHILRITKTLIQSDKAFHSNQGDRSYTIGSTLKETSLSKRESDCVFFLIRGKTMKEIAKCLDLSPRTVEAYIVNIKLKWGCTNQKEVIACAISNGYLNFVPDNMISTRVSSIL